MSFVCRWVGIPIVPMRSVLKRVGDPGSIGLDVNLVRDVRPRYALSEKNHSPESVFVLRSISPRNPGGPGRGGLAGRNGPPGSWPARNVPALNVGWIACSWWRTAGKKRAPTPCRSPSEPANRTPGGAIRPTPARRLGQTVPGKDPLASPERPDPQNSWPENPVPS